MHTPFFRWGKLNAALKHLLHGPSGVFRHGNRCYDDNRRKRLKLLRSGHIFYLFISNIKYTIFISISPTKHNKFFEQFTFLSISFSFLILFLIKKMDPFDLFNVTSPKSRPNPRDHLCQFLKVVLSHSSHSVTTMQEEEHVISFIRSSKTRILENPFDHNPNHIKTNHSPP